MIANIFSGYLAGLSVGVYCLGLCLPIFLPVLLSQKRTAKRSIFLILEFSLGRLLGYLFFGLIFGWFGQMIRNDFIHLIAGLTNLWLGILMIVYSLGLIDKKFCSLIPFTKIKWPIALGFLTGVNICPPFLGSLAYVFNLKSLILSLLYFLMFFFGNQYLYCSFYALRRFFRKELVAGFSSLERNIGGNLFYC